MALLSSPVSSSIANCFARRRPIPVPTVSILPRLPLKHLSLLFNSSSSSRPCNTAQISMSSINVTGVHNHFCGSSNSTTTSINVATEKEKRSRRLPLLLFDIMDTIVRDPFYQDIPAFFGMSLKELIECKHPTAWIEFEKGLIDEMELARKYFKDGRPFDLEGLKNCVRMGYSYLEGMEGLLSALKQNNYEMHALTNYAIWYEMIEDKLKLSTYLSWSFCSCIFGKRKPDLTFYSEAVKRLDVEPGNCIFIDDRLTNVDAAMEAGMVGLHFKDVNALCKDLSLHGIQIDMRKMKNGPNGSNNNLSSSCPK